jgi:putative nucleotidyltransferase with HDIG domain
MKKARPTDEIDVQALRVGMYVHLDIGWMSHPFPLSSFRITTAAQLATIRTLGLRTVRWSPQQSELAQDAAARAMNTLPGPLPVPGDAANDSGLGDPDAIDTVPYLLPVDDNVVSAAVHAAQRAQAERTRKLARQREAEERCTRQYGEAARACRNTLDLVVAKPQEAREQAEALSRSVIDKMVGEQDLCIRMIAEGAGDKASMHAMNVGIVSLLMGRCFGFSDEEMQDLGVGAMLHDVGKLELPARLRHREDNFSPNEARVYEEHVEMGLVQARRMGLSAGAMAVIAQHHEHADGSGFPAKLNSDRMTMAARIVALVNRYDNLCNPHLLARAMTPH